MKKTKIEQCVNIFETGSIHGNYSDVSIFRDGPHDVRQLTYGRSQTTQYGNLGDLLKMYGEANGEFSSELLPYADKMKDPQTVSDSKLIHLLKEAGKDPVMQATQDEFFDSHYWEPALKFFTDHGFKEDLSMLVIYDSYIHSGSIPMYLRRRFDEVPPDQGGDEKQWIKKYVYVRHDWLSNHSREILRKTSYRTKVFKEMILKNDWNLDEKYTINGVELE